MASGEKIIRQVLAALDAGDMPDVLRLMTHDVRFRFGSADTTVGHDGVTKSLAKLAPVVASLSHKLLQVWTVEAPEPAVLCEMDVTYQRHDGSVVTLPCFDLIRMRDGLIADCRIYMDITPVFSA